MTMPVASSSRVVIGFGYVAVLVSYSGTRVFLFQDLLIASFAV